MAINKRDHAIIMGYDKRWDFFSYPSYVKSILDVERIVGPALAQQAWYPRRVPFYEEKRCERVKLCRIDLNQIYTIFYINHIFDENEERYDLIARINHGRFHYFMQMTAIHTRCNDRWGGSILLARELNEYFLRCITWPPECERNKVIECMIDSVVGSMLIEINKECGRFIWRTTPSEKTDWFKGNNLNVGWFNIYTEEIDRIYYVKFTPSMYSKSNGYDIIARITKPNDDQQHYYIQVMAFSGDGSSDRCTGGFTCTDCHVGRVLISRDLGKFIKEFDYPEGCNENLVEYLMKEDLDEAEENADRWSKNLFSSF